MQITQKLPLLVSGRLVGDDGQAQAGHALVVDGRIESVTSSPPSLPAGTLVFDAGPDSYVFPGLINLHDHIDANLLPVWPDPLAPWDNRFEWLNNKGYAAAVVQPLDFVREHWEAPLRAGGPNIGIVLQALGELRAAAGGTTTLQEELLMFVDETQLAPRELILLRNTGVPEDMNLPAGELVIAPNFFYQPDPEPAGLPRQDSSSWVPVRTGSFAGYILLASAGRLHASTVHLAEGRSGVGLYEQGVDPYSRTEFETFVKDLQALDRNAIVGSRLNLVHGCGMDVFAGSTADLMHHFGLGLIWSPVSNMLLYRDVTFAPALMARGINTSLGSDWSPTGSKHVWAEAQYARRFMHELGVALGDEQIYRMITSNPARAIDVQAGRIAAGHFGDFFVLRAPSPQHTPLETLFAANDAHTRVVIAGGTAVYGDPEVCGLWPTPVQQLPAAMGAVAATKAVALPPELGIDLARDYPELLALFGRAGVSPLALPLAVDDAQYQAAMSKLDEYTLDYARAQASPDSPISIWKRSQ